MKNTKFNDKQINKIISSVGIKVSDTKIILPPSRLSFSHINQPRDGYYDATFIFDKSMTSFVNDFKKLIEDYRKANGLDADVYTPIREQNEKYSGCEIGGYQISASSKYKINVIGSDKKILTDDEIYNGMWCISSVSLYINKKKTSIGLNLRSIMKLYDDEKFTSNVVTSDFNDVELTKFNVNDYGNDLI